MKIRYKASFINRLEKQIEYIAKDNPQAAINFRDELMERIQQILQNPYLYRKSVYFNDPSIRDLIFKGYTIVFRISNEYRSIWFCQVSEKAINRKSPNSPINKSVGRRQQAVGNPRNRRSEIRSQKRIPRLSPIPMISSW